MKRLFFIPVMFAFLSCNTGSNTKVPSTENIDSNNSRIKKDSIVVVKPSISPTMDTVAHESNKLIGFWALEDSEDSGNVTFEIRKSTFYYPEHNTAYKYKMVGDSIKIKYEDYEGSFAFKFKNKDVLVLAGEDGEYTYKRVK